MVESNLISSMARERNDLEPVAPQSSTQALYVSGVDGFREADEQDVIILAQELIARRFRRGFPVLNHPQAVRAFLRLHMAPLKQMHFAALFLDRRKRLISYHELFKGTIDGVSVHPREVARDALAFNAIYIILLRNDPCGEATFAEADKLIGRRLCDALKQVDITVLDYLLVGERVISGVEEGWIERPRYSSYLIA